jgi:hypothetical protein
MPDFDLLADLAKELTLQAIRDRADFPLPAAQLNALTPQKNALTNAELRLTPVAVDTGLAQPTTPLDTQPVSAQALPLPTGAATAAAQTTQQGTLQAILDRADFPLPAAQHQTLQDILQRTPDLAVAFALGRVRHVGVAVTSGLSSTQSFLMRNPVGTGVNLRLVAAILACSVVATLSLRRGATLSAPTTHTPYNPNFLYPLANKAIIESQTDALSGGTALASAIRLAADIPVLYQLPFLVPPGDSLGVTGSFGTGATTFVTFIYVEDPA